MDITYNSQNIEIFSEKKKILLSPENIILDELLIDCPGEYEKWGFLLYAREHNEILYYHFRVEGNWIAYIPQTPSTEIDSQILEFFWQIDILIAPFSKTEQKYLEQIEPKMLVSFKENAADLTPILGEPLVVSSSYRLKSQDISSDKTSFAILV